MGKVYTSYSHFEIIIPGKDVFLTVRILDPFPISRSNRRDRCHLTIAHDLKLASASRISLSAARFRLHRGELIRTSALAVSVRLNSGGEFFEKRAVHHARSA
ncbi:hypothetical protein N7488_002188 [Penicillium malachiteum]|nr:hypothetical protein N7488_002188 [Penicillium malachiteum]